MLKQILDAHVLGKNTNTGLFEYPDPLQIATSLKEPFGALVCALFAYGNAKLIVKFLNSLDFSLLDADENLIKKAFQSHKYRFQNTRDVSEIFITLRRAKLEFDMEQIFINERSIIDGINSLIRKIYSLNEYRSDGYEFFFGRAFEDTPKSPYKRYNMFLRWMVRDRDIDLGLFKHLSKSSLLLPLDVHTHRVSLSLGLCTRKSYDFASVVEITKRLQEFDPDDPIKYDFALYRIGQKSELDKVLSQLKTQQK